MAVATPIIFAAAATFAVFMGTIVLAALRLRHMPAQADGVGTRPGPGTAGPVPAPPHPAGPHAPLIQQLHDDSLTTGHYPFHLPVGVDLDESNSDRIGREVLSLLRA